ncbi:MAG TPA: hypothetical protein VK961_16160 [Chthoniobacter sp.]|nr:hypothetical protein [Chthoniobacter sp.]
MSQPPSSPLEKGIALRAAKALALLLLVAVGTFGCWEGFRQAKLHLALKRAHREAANRQFMRAEFWTSRAFTADPKSVEATRLMAEIYEAQDRPEGLGWRIRVVQRAPHSTADVLAWAKSAFRFGRRDMALNALKSLPSDFQSKSSDFHELMAGCALGVNDLAGADLHFQKALELDRDNPVQHVNLAAFQLTYSNDRATRVTAGQYLEGALNNPQARLYAARALLTLAMRSRDRTAARNFAEKLRAMPEHTFSDDLNCLEVSIGEPAFQPALAEIEHRAETDPQWPLEVSNWLNAHGMAAETRRWFAQLPEPLQANVRLQMAVAESYLALADWNGLETFLAPLHWDEGEFLRRAMIIRSKRERSYPWEKEWAQFAADVAAKPPDGFLLAQVMVGWKWREQALQLLWDATVQPSTNPLALQSLWDLYSQKNETREMLKVARAQVELDPSNATRKNNEAFLSLLLHGASARAERLAREATTSDPNVAEWAATYAYALHLAKKDAEAKRVLASLTPEARSRPGVGLYYAIVLAANGDEALAREALEKLDSRGMLPEERKLASELAEQLHLAIR